MEWRKDGREGQGRGRREGRGPTSKARGERERKGGILFPGADGDGRPWVY